MKEELKQMAEDKKVMENNLPITDEYIKQSKIKELESIKSEIEGILEPCHKNNAKFAHYTKMAAIEIIDRHIAELSKDD